MIRSLLKSLLIAALLVPFSFALPFCALRLCRTPGGAQFLFWVGPWSCCVLVLFYSQLPPHELFIVVFHDSVSSVLTVSVFLLSFRGIATSEVSQLVAERPDLSFDVTPPQVKQSLPHRLR